MSLKKNVIANYLGQGWTGLISLAFVPLYIKYLGIEAYGLIGLFALLQAWLVLLDMGMSPTLNREVARQAAGASSAESLRDLVHTFEVIITGVAILIVFLLVAASDWVAQDWLNAKGLSGIVVAQSLSIMGFVAALRFIEGLYRGAILGLQMHVWLNVVTSGFATIRAIGAVCVLIWVAPSIQVFFWWQAFISGVTLIVFYLGVHRYLPTSTRPAVFSIHAVSNAWKFAAGVFATTLLALMLTQIDKVLLSRLLSLEVFGAYMFAAAVAGVLFQLIGPIAQSYYPRLTELSTTGDRPALSAAYHQAAQLMTIMLAPAGLLLIAFGEPVIYAWTGDRLLAENAAEIVAILAIGTILNGWMHIPYMLQLASGWSSFAVWMNLVAAVILVPMIFWVTPRYGPVGAAWVWVAVNAGYVLFAIHFMHARLLPGEKAAWYVRDLAVPTLSACVVVGTSYFFHPSLGRVGDVAWVGITGGLAFVATVLGASEFRYRVFRFFVFSGPSVSK
ncbi:MAG: lipopolysaccharide biosynthesis protein [Thiobacillus sp.]